MCSVCEKVARCASRRRQGSRAKKHRHPNGSVDSHLYYCWALKEHLVSSQIISYVILQRQTQGDWYRLLSGMSYYVRQWGHLTRCLNRDAHWMIHQRCWASWGFSTFCTQHGWGNVKLIFPFVWPSCLHSSPTPVTSRPPHSSSSAPIPRSCWWNSPWKGGTRSVSPTALM